MHDGAIPPEPHAQAKEAVWGCFEIPEEARLGERKAVSVRALPGWKLWHVGIRVKALNMFNAVNGTGGYKAVRTDLHFVMTAKTFCSQVAFEFSLKQTIVTHRAELQLDSGTSQCRLILLEKKVMPMCSCLDMAARLPSCSRCGILGTVWRMHRLRDLAFRPFAASSAPHTRNPCHAAQCVPAALGDGEGHLWWLDQE
jgi:hypothetical protein